MVNVDLQWLDAMTKAGREFTRTERAAGWPQSMRPVQFASLQRPWEDDVGRAACNALQRALIIACETGAIAHETTTGMGRTRPEDSPSGYIYPSEYKEITLHHITAQALDAWMAAQRPQAETPSGHIAAWFEVMRVNNTPVTADVPTPAPPSETLAKRNDRWLVQFDIEETRKPRGAYNRTAAHFNANSATLRKAVGKARKHRADKYRAGITTVTGKSKKSTSPFDWQTTSVKVGKKPSR